MRYKTVFRLLLKAIGVWVFVQGLAAGVDRLDAWITYAFWWLAPGTWVPPVPRIGPGMVSAQLFASLLNPLAQLALGAYLFFGGKWLADLAIPGNRPYCPECGYDLTGAVATRCPECGTPWRLQDVAPSEISREADL
ncbi:MAG TPA: hypothetical protein PLC79_06090 [Phycisphaerae bacterium]|nr:hypothetical protein [Phycisphaerae bacterium]